MWCTQCHTPFDWNTGQIIKHQNIHNPHFYEWQQTEGGRNYINTNHLPCGGVQIQHFANRHIHEYVRIITHINDRTIRAFTETKPIDNQFQELRVQYLLGHLDKDKLKAKLQILDKRIKRKVELREVLHMYTTVAIEMLQEVQRGTTDEQNERFKQVQRLREMANKSLLSIAVKYNSTSAVHIPENGDLTDTLKVDIKKGKVVEYKGYEGDKLLITSTSLDSVVNKLVDRIILSCNIPITKGTAWMRLNERCLKQILGRRLLRLFSVLLPKKIKKKITNKKNPKRISN